MKKISVLILCVSVFFMGLGSLLQETGAKVKSDERALEIIRQARAAIGGEENINRVNSLTINGKITQNFVFDEVNRSETADLEINLQLPNLFTKAIKMQRKDGEGGSKERIELKEVDVVVNQKVEGVKEIPADGQNRVIIIKKDKDGKTLTEDVKELPIEKQGNVIRLKKDDKTPIEEIRGGEGKSVFVTKNVETSGSPMIYNELWRMTLGLLLSIPQNSDVSYTFGGEENVDGISCEIVNAQTGDSTIKLYFDKASRFPVMMTWRGTNFPKVIRLKKDDMKNVEEKELKILSKIEGNETTDFQLKFSDYRSVNGLQMPFRWVQNAGGKADQVVEVISYEVNPPNIAEKFKKLPGKVMMKIEQDKK